ncbi:MAG: membrane or secreted protein [Planctomycetota bacterium]|jgi:hypothetical protein
MGQRFWSLLTAVSCLCAAGCSGLGSNWSRPGTAAIQQERAEVFDPYPENDVGPPVVGGRPRGYQKATAEPFRARWFCPQPGPL